MRINPRIPPNFMWCHSCAELGAGNAFGVYLAKAYTTMNDLIELIAATLEDEILSRKEKKSIKHALAKQPLDAQQQAFIRSKVFDLAMERVTADNYGRIISWLEEANKSLAQPGNTEKLLSEGYFSPGDACRDAIITQLRQATKRVDICVFTISDNQLSEVILEVHQRSLPVRIITDNDKLHDAGSDIEWLAKKGLPIRVDETSNHMHHKYAVIDKKYLLTGSYNWTRSAARFNHENLLITDEPGVVNQYFREFERLWDEMVPFV